MLQFNWLTSLTDKLRANSTRRIQARRKRSQHRSFRASHTSLSNYVAESLEDRMLLTAFTVVNTNDSGEGSLREAIEQANASEGADSITFAATLSGQSIVLNNQLRITDDLTITGLGADQLTIDANHNSRIFDIYDGSHIANIYVEISGLTLANGNGTKIPDLENTTPSVGLGGQISYKRNPNGGAIFNNEFLTVSDLILRDNQASIGGAIFGTSGSGATASIRNSVFIGNEARTGGAIYSSGSMIVIDSSFVANKAVNDGGAIYSKLLTVTGSSFTDNIAMGSGGAIYHNYGNMNISDCTFYRNVASLNGGGIYNSYRQIWVKEEVTIPDGPHQGLKLAYLVRTYNLTEITNSEFIENSASSGGGIYSVQLSPETHPAVFSIIDPNQVVEVDSAIDFENDFDPKIVISNSSFSGNTAQTGAGIRNRSGKMKVQDSLFSDNSVTHSGGGLHNSGSLFIETSTFTDNSANSGGGLYNFGNLLIEAITLSGNQAVTSGGGVASFLGHITFRESIFDGNSAGISGGGVYLIQGSNGILIDEMGHPQSAPPPTIENSIFSGNSAHMGGGIYNSPFMDDLGSRSLSIINTTFSENSATNSGGAIHNRRTRISITGSEFSENTAVDGGGINNHAGSILLKDSTLSGNYATGFGGAIKTIGHMSVINTTLSGNHADHSGGGIYHSSGNEFKPISDELNSVIILSPLEISNELVMADAAFIGSTVVVVFSSPSVADSVPVWLIHSSLKITNSTIVGNSAGLSAGGISTPGSGTRSTTIVNNSIVAGNTAASFFQIIGNFSSNTSIIQDSVEGLLDPVLRDNGGPTKTHALVAGSAAINAGNNEATLSAELTNDQRGIGYERIFGETVDIGAFEFQTLIPLVDFEFVTGINEEVENLEIQAVDSEADPLPDPINIDVNPTRPIWNSDVTPTIHNEFNHPSQLSLIELLNDNPESSQMDLLSVIDYELGQEDEGTMEDPLASEVRKLPLSEEGYQEQDSISKDETDEFFTSLKESSNLIAF